MIQQADYFSLFDFKPQFNIDQDALKQRYLELQMQIHPDRYADKSAQEQRVAVQLTTQINDAYKTLKNPVSRAQYLLKLKAPSASAKLAPEFLMQQMELHEQLDDIKSNQSIESLHVIKHQVQSLQDDLLQTMAQQLEQQQWNTAYQSIEGLQFYVRLLQQIDDLEFEWNG